MNSSELFGKTVVLARLGYASKLPLAFLFGCLFGLSSPGFELWWLAWIGLAPLLILVQALDTKLQAALTGLAFGLGYHLVGLSWYLGLESMSWLGIHEIFGWQLTILVWLIEALHQSILMSAFALMLFCLPLRPGFLPNIERPFFPHLVAIPLLWVFLQWMVAPSEFFVGLPINQLAYSQYKQLSFIQIASVGGSGLLDFLIVLVNATIANAFLELTNLAHKLGERTDQLSTKFGSVVDVVVSLSLVIGLCAWGGQRVSRLAFEFNPATAMQVDPQLPPVAVAVVQGNVTIEEEKLKVTKPVEIAKRYANLANNLGAAILFLPEGVVNSTQMQGGHLLSLMKGISAKQQKEVVFGSIETLENGLVNAVRLISPFKPKEDLYIKRRLVPLGEAAPTEALNERIPAPLRERIPATREAFLAGNQTHLLESGWGKMGPSIYIELIYPNLIADEVRRGASLLVNVSNLAWFHDSSINRQILAAAVLRAVENERYFVVATNTGISAIIKPTGLISSESLPGERGVLLDTIQFLYRKTPFSKMWWL